MRPALRGRDQIDIGLINQITSIDDPFKRKVDRFLVTRRTVQNNLFWNRFGAGQRIGPTRRYAFAGSVWRTVPGKRSK